jgi:hypothetical protein
MDDRSAEAQSLIRTIQIPAISKATLQSICAVNGIPKTGNKSDLQRRIITRKATAALLCLEIHILFTTHFRSLFFPSLELHFTL